MKKMNYTRDATIARSGMATEPVSTPETDAEDRSKDAFFVSIAEITEAMIARHGKDFAMGTLVLSARFVAEGKPLIKRKNGSDDSKTGSAAV